MGDRRQPVLGDVFAAWDDLEVGVRIGVAALVLVPGATPALLPGELAAAPLPEGSARRDALVASVAAGLNTDALTRWRSERFDGLVPKVRGRQTAVASAKAPERLRALLARNGVATWAELGQCSPDDVQRWVSAGPATVASLIVVAVDASLSWLADEALVTLDAQPVAASSPGTEYHDLAVILARERQSGADDLHRVISRHTLEGQPDEVRAAATRLLAAVGPEPGLERLNRVLEAVGDERTRFVFERLALGMGRPSVAEVAAAIERSKDRARSLRIRAADRVRAVAADLPAVIGDAVDELRRQVGAAAPLEAVDAALAASGWPALPDSRSALLLWLAGPFAEVGGHPGWIAGGGVDLCAETKQMVGEDGGVRLFDHVAKEFDSLGLADRFVEAWLAEFPVRRVGELVVDLTGSCGDVAERALSALGRSMDIDELAGWFATGPRRVSTEGLETVLRRDDRFVRVGSDTFDLAEWGADPYDEAPSLFAEDDAGPEVDRNGRCWLPVTVDAGVLAGAGAGVPRWLVQRLSVAAGARRDFATRYGPLTLSNDPGGPTRSSLRPVVLAAGAGPGEVILLGFAVGHRDVLVELAPVGTEPAPLQ